MISWAIRRLAVPAVLLGGLFPPQTSLAEKIQETPITQATERHLPSEQTVLRWAYEPEKLEVLAADRMEMVEVEAVTPNTVKLTDVVKPIYFESGVANIPADTIAELKAVLEDMRERYNVRLNLVGHADNRPLSAQLAEVYVDNAGLSEARAGQVAEYFQSALGLAPDVISYEWAGDSQPIASNNSSAGRALNRRVEVEVWYDELEDAVALEERLVLDPFERVKICRIETVCKLRYVEGHERRARVMNLMAPLRYQEGAVDVTPEFTRQVAQTLENLSDKQNVVIKFVGFTDGEPLTGAAERIYGSHEALSKATARRVALSIQDSLGLETGAVTSDGKGASRPLASNATAGGRALNRRVEVEFWYDDPLQDLPDEPQLCPAESGAEMVTRVFDPPWGSFETIDINAGEPVVPAGLTTSLERALEAVADKTNPRLRFVGYTQNERLDRRTAQVYGDDIGLSAARARRTMEAVTADPLLADVVTEIEGRGYLHSNDVVNAGFIQGDKSFVAVEVIYDELAVLDDNEGVDVTRLTRELAPEHPFALNLMRITVDGEPIDDPRRSSADVQRCTDVAMKRADIQFGFDNLTSSPRLSVASSASVLGVREEDGSIRDAIRFRMYDNYGHFIDRAEIRVFEQQESPLATPAYVVEVGEDGSAEWRPDIEPFSGPVRELKYVLRAYGADGNFDETVPQPLWVLPDIEVANLERKLLEHFSEPGIGGPDSVRPEPETKRPEVAMDPLLAQQLLAGYGDNALAMHNIRLSSGTVRVQGSEVPEGHTVYVAGRPVPVDAGGNFVSEEILPEGAHTVEVAVLDQKGRGESYLRDLEFEPSDWFYVGMADVTLSANTTNGPMDELTGDNPMFDYDSAADGRLAFYVNGKFGNKWRLTASADTREGPLDEIFSSFMDKTPDALFRRIDPDYHYPTFGDDSSVDETAPTLGKFYVKLSQRKNHAMWGNFKVGYLQNELAQVDRGLYGTNLHYETSATTTFGEQRLALDAFAAEPGTIASRQEFRGTGGSLYYLRNRDLMVGSERLRIEVRDRASGIVTGVVNLTPTIDYDIDYLQGSVLLTEPLSSTVSDNLLVRAGALGGDEAYLVVRYEYSPGFDQIDALSAGTQGHVWLTNFMKVGFVANANEEGDSDSTLGGVDLTIRKSAESWLKLQGAETDGLVSGTLVSNDGGFGFTGTDDASFVDAAARAYRADLSIGLDDVWSRLDGRVTLYAQELEAGYSAPGLTTPGAVNNFGGALSVPITDRLALTAKNDRRVQEQGIETRAWEVNGAYQLTRNWDLSAGVRQDRLIDRAPVVAPTQNEGQRTDAIVQVGFDPGGTWSAYGFVQDTIQQEGDRLDNSRIGMGSTVRISEKLTIDSEFSSGTSGPGGRLGTNYIHSDRTSLYLTYALENERTGPNMSAPQGGGGTLVSGMKTRLSDSTSVYLESRYRHGSTATGLTHATGVNFSTAENWSMGVNADIGTLQDLQTGAETERRAGGLRVGYGGDKLSLSSGVEYRADDTEQLDLSTATRTTWLYRNNLKYQIAEGSRLLGKLNHSNSTSSLGDFFAGGYTEAVLGYAFRPVSHDRLNAMAKYTFFYNVPTTDQLTLNGSAAEYLQKSHVASLDVTYDLTARWSVGGKYAYRLGQLSFDRENPEFFDNTASLYVLRADYRFLENWEVLLEGRMLQMHDFDEQRAGALATLSRNVGDHFKVGVGYNFTDFSSDLTDLSFDHQGVFLNFTGAF